MDQIFFVIGSFGKHLLVIGYLLIDYQREIIEQDAYAILWQNIKLD